MKKAQEEKSFRVYIWIIAILYISLDLSSGPYFNLH